MCSKLDFFLSGIRNQPHLWMSRQPGPSADFPADQGTTNFQAVYQNPKFSQVPFKILSHYFMARLCGFHSFCGNRMKRRMETEKRAIRDSVTMLVA